MAWVINPTVTVNGVSYNSNAVGSVNITYGRTSVWEPQNAGYARVQLLNTNNTAFAIDLNQTVIIKLKNAAGSADITVFTGTVTNIDNGIVLYSGTTNLASVTITAVAPLSVLARTQVSLVDYPAESDNARISRILTEAGVTIDTLDPTIYNYIARAKSPTTALALGNYYAQMSTGSLYETKDGKVGFDSQYSRNTDVSVNGYFAINPAYTNWANVKSNTAIGELINSVNLTYGGGSTVTADNTTSQTTYGKMAATIKTEVDNVDDATSLANLYLAMRAYPQTSLQSIEIALNNPTMDNTTIDKMLNVYFGLPISITGAPVPIFNGVYYGFVEGWNLTFNQIVAKIELKTSYKTYSYRPTIWSSVNPATQWSAVTATTQWKDYE